MPVSYTHLDVYKRQVLGGMGVAQWLGGSPLVGATVAAILAALLIGWISHRGHQREDMLIGAVWAVGMAVGIVAIARTPGYSSELMSYLLGNLLMVTREQVWLMAALNAAMLLMLALFWRPLMALSLIHISSSVRRSASASAAEPRFGDRRCRASPDAPTRP